MRLKDRTRLAITLGGAALSATTMLAILPVAQAQTTITTVMTGLNSPRHMAFGPDGNLYVTEAGTGGNGTTIVDGSNTSVSYGTTSSISELNLTTLAQTKVLTGAPSLAPAGGAGATGLHDITFIGNTAYAIIGFGADPNLLSNYNSTTEPGAALLDKLVTVSLDGTSKITVVADLGAYEKSANPGQDEFNSNPFGLTALPDGTLAVTDAGGNSLLKVSTSGTVSTLVGGTSSVLGPKPNPLFGTIGGPTYEAVPTSVAVNPLNGNYYFTQLTGFPFVPGSANIFEYNPLTGTTSIAYTGFTNLMDLTFDPLGNLYAVQYDTNGLASASGPGSGQLIEIGANGARNTLVSTGLVFPTAVAYGPDGSLYVANAGSGAGAGSVIRITIAAPEPGSLALLAFAGLPILGGIRKRAKRRA